MKWKLQKIRDQITNSDIFDLHIEISDADMIKMGLLNDFDRILFEECEKSECCSDKLLALEMFIRKIERGSSD